MIFFLHLSLIFYNHILILFQGTSMRLPFLLLASFLISGCVNTDVIDVPSSTEQRSTTQILDNQIEAQDARDEYKKLQEQRDQE